MGLSSSAHVQSYRLRSGLECAHVVLIRRPRRRLDRVDVVCNSSTQLRSPSTTKALTSPPRPRSPPQSPLPHIGILRHVIEPTVISPRNLTSINTTRQYSHPLNSTHTLRIRTPRKLPNKPNLPIRSQPLRRRLHPLLPNRRTHTLGMRSASITIQILMHLVHYQVTRVRQRAHSSAVFPCCPCPCAVPIVALDVDVLLYGASGADAVDGRLVELHDEGLVHVVDCIAR
jgi:hypothetical protein